MTKEQNALMGLVFLTFMVVFPMAVVAIWTESWKLGATAGLCLVTSFILGFMMTEYFDG